MMPLFFFYLIGKAYGQIFFSQANGKKYKSILQELNWFIVHVSCFKDKLNKNDGKKSWKEYIIDLCIIFFTVIIRPSWAESNF